MSEQRKWEAGQEVYVLCGGEYTWGSIDSITQSGRINIRGKHGLKVQFNQKGMRRVGQGCDSKIYRIDETPFALRRDWCYQQGALESREELRNMVADIAFLMADFALAVEAIGDLVEIPRREL